MNRTDLFLEAMERVWQTPLPARILARARKALLDYLAVTMAGARSLEDKARAYLEAADPEPGRSSVIGTGRKLNLKEAVFLNGLNAHALDLDDGINEGIIHPGSPLLSVLLPLAEKYDLSFDRFLRTLVLGYEAAFNLASSIQPLHKSLGYHATGTCGVLSSALAASYLLDLPHRVRKNALAAASVSASGVLNVLDEGSELKPYNVAKASLLGLISLQMARAGFLGPKDPLGGERGFLKMMTARDDIRLKAPLEGGRFAVERAYVKPYAACRYCHPAIEAGIGLGENDDYQIEDIEEVEVRTYHWAVANHDHTEVPTGASAKMSIPYSVALALLHARAGLGQYESPYLEEDKLLALTAKVKVLSDPDMTALFPQKTLARVSLKMKDGRHLSRQVDLPKGEPEKPLSDAEFADRFKDLLSYSGRDEEDAARLMDLVNGLEGGMAPLFELIG